MCNTFTVSNSRWNKRVEYLGKVLLVFLLFSCRMGYAQVPAGDATLLPVITDGLPIVAVTTGYDMTESTFNGNTNYALPLYYPYAGQTSPAWWDQLVSEQQQARLPVLGMIAGGPANQPNPQNWSHNPFYLPQYIAALQRYGVANSVKLACCPFGGFSNDLSNQAVWNQWWNVQIGPWMAGVPQSYWFMFNGGLSVEFWGVASDINTQGNVTSMFQFLNAQAQANYGVSLSFEDCNNDTSFDTTLASYPRFVALNPWFTSTGYGYNTYNGVTVGTLVPGFNNGSLIISRKGASGTGALGDTLRQGLTAALSQNVDLARIEGWTDQGEGCQSYRCSTQTITTQSSNWATPNQYVNIVRSYTDLRTTTLRLDAVDCDSYNDPGGVGGVYRRAPSTLDCALKNGTPTASASSAASGYPAGNAFIGNGSWRSSSAAPGWVQMDLGSGNTNTVTSYFLTSSPDSSLMDPSAWQFQASNDGSTWTTLDTKSGQTFASRNLTVKYSISNTTPYEFYRLNVTATAGGGSNNIELLNLAFGTSNSTGGGWVVSNTKAGEWIEWDGISFAPGNYKFPVCYSSTASHQLQLQIDGTTVSTVTVSSTGSLNTYSTAYLATTSVASGTHNLRLVFVDGGPNVQWMFIKKYDPQMSFQSAVNGCYVTAIEGGNVGLRAANSTAAGAYENFTVNDMSGAGTVSSGDSVSLQSYDGLYLTADGGGGSDMQNNHTSPGAWETFNIMKINGSGSLSSGNYVAIKTSSGKYLTVEKNGSVDATGTSIGSAQTFVVQVSQIGSVPAIPSSLSATAPSGNQVNLSWTNNANNQSGFVIERSCDGKTYSVIATVGSGSTTYSDGSVGSSTLYYYQVLATNATGNSSPSNVVTVTTPAGAPGAINSLLLSYMPSGMSSMADYLSWSAVPGATGYTVQRSTTSGSGYATLASNVSGTSYIDSTVSNNGTVYYYVVTATNSYGASTNSNQVTAIPNQTVTQTSMGTSGGTVSYSSGNFTLASVSGDVWNSSDVCTYASIPMNGDGTIIAKITSISTTNGWAKAGVMMRETLNAGATNAFMSLTGGNGSNFQYRTTTSGSSGFSGRNSAIVAPQWVMLTRSGSVFTGYFSNDGVNWTVQGSITISMATSYYVGLADSGSSTTTFTSAVITPDQHAVPRNLIVSYTPGASGALNPTINWIAPSVATNYTIYRSTTSGGPYTSIGTTAANAYTDTTGTSGTTYYYVVTAWDGIGNSAYSAQVSATPGTIPLGKTISLQAQSNSLWVCADNNGVSPLIANRGNPGTWESFVVVDESATYGPGYVALKSLTNGFGSNEYVTAANSSTTLIANSTTVGSTQVFYWQSYGNGSLSLQSYGDSLWVSAVNASSPLIANRVSPSTWETYTLKIW